MELDSLYYKCNLCPRKCSVDRSKTTGFCKMNDKLRVARIAPHYWEEPCLSGKNGSGAVFFSGCSLQCVYCQNFKIARGSGTEISIEYLAEKMLKMQEIGVHNINLVTATQFIPSIIPALEIAKKQGLNIPIVYNSSGYETTETLKILDGYIDIYLPDYKYSDSTLAKKYSNDSNYPDIAKFAIKEMFSQVGTLTFDNNGMLQKGVIIRVLALPNCENNTKEILKYIKKEYKGKVAVSLMSQYTPMPQVCANYPELARKITREEYDELCGYAKGLRLDNVYIQDGEAASESFIPDFDAEEI